MAGSYVIFGKTFQAYQLSYMTLLTAALGTGYALYGPKKPAPAPVAVAPAEPVAGSQEDDFIA